MNHHWKSTTNLQRIHTKTSGSKTLTEIVSTSRRKAGKSSQKYWSSAFVRGRRNGMRHCQRGGPGERLPFVEDAEAHPGALLVTGAGFIDTERGYIAKGQGPTGGRAMDLTIDEQVFSKPWFHGVNDEEKGWLDALLQADA